MGIFSWILLGLLAGVIAKQIMPGKDPGGIVMTIAVGMAGAVVGGYVGSLLGFGSVGGFDLRGLAIAVGGALLLLIAYRFVAPRLQA